MRGYLGVDGALPQSCLVLVEDHSDGIQLLLRERLQQRGGAAPGALVLLLLDTERHLSLNTGLHTSLGCTEYNLDDGRGLME